MGHRGLGYPRITTFCVQSHGIPCNLCPHTWSSISWRNRTLHACNDTFYSVLHTHAIASIHVCPRHLYTSGICPPPAWPSHCCSQQLYVSLPFTRMLLGFWEITNKTSNEDSNTDLKASSFPSKIGLLLCLTKLLSDLYGGGTVVQEPAPLALLPAPHYE